MGINIKVYFCYLPYKIKDCVIKNKLILLIQTRYWNIIFKISFQMITDCVNLSYYLWVREWESELLLYISTSCVAPDSLVKNQITGLDGLMFYDLLSLFLKIHVCLRYVIVTFIWGEWCMYVSCLDHVWSPKPLSPSQTPVLSLWSLPV